MIHINTQGQLIRTLKKNTGKNIVIHYTCPFCNAEQATDQEEADDILETFEEHEHLTTGYFCTSCGMNMAVVYLENIFGIDVIDEK